MGQGASSGQGMSPLQGMSGGMKGGGNMSTLAGGRPMMTQPQRGYVGADPGTVWNNWMQPQTQQAMMPQMSQLMQSLGRGFQPGFGGNQPAPNMKGGGNQMRPAPMQNPSIVQQPGGSFGYGPGGSIFNR